MQYHSILFPYGRPRERVSDELLRDLRIDSVLSMLSHGPDQLKYDTCYLPLTDKDSVLFRHAVFQDIMRSDLHPVFIGFQELMDSLGFMEETLKRLSMPVLRSRYLLNRMIEYKKHVLFLCDTLTRAPLQSEGLRQFASDLAEYTRSDVFQALCEDTDTLKKELEEVTYTITVRDNHIAVRKLPPDAFDEQEKTAFEKEINVFFDKFIHGRADFSPATAQNWEMNPVEEEILKALMKLFPEPFSHLDTFYRKREKFVPEELVSYHQDLGFYTVWLEYILPRQADHMGFCFPMITDRKDGIIASNCFDLILADQKRKEGQQVIRNNLILNPGEHILVLTGPNQGGKTTYARMLGQLFYLGSLGIPVPGTAVKFFLPDRIFTHFERQESQETLNGKLKDDILRIHDILEHASENSLILINEMFSSTTLQDAAWLGKEILSRIEKIGSLCLYVTFINELSSWLPGTVSLISQIGEDRKERTYQIVRDKSDGRAYARTMVQKYALTYEEISERIRSST